MNTRDVDTRLVICGELVLCSPASFGDGERGEAVDLMLLRDRDGRPLLQGTSLAGAMRSYLRSREYGYRTAEARDGRGYAAALFGGVKGQPDGAQSPLIVEDSWAAHDAVTEIRDGVRIDPRTRTAADGLKYDRELLAPGTRFPLQLEVLLPGHGKLRQRITAALRLILEGFEQQEIRLGARTSRGYGRCHVATWTVERYEVRSDLGQALAWVTRGLEVPGLQRPAPRVGSAAEVLDDGQADVPVLAGRHARVCFDVQLASPLLIRSSQPLTADGLQPDTAYLRDGTDAPIIPGTSLAGVLRAQATRIVALLARAAGATMPRAQAVAQQFIDRSFGVDMRRPKAEPTASRWRVDEVRLCHTRTVVQPQVGIDVFTGGADDGRLFTSAPLVAGAARLQIDIHDPCSEEIGMLLLLVRDLWLGDLAIGGNSSVGRGRLAGQRAEVYLPSSDTPITITLDAAGALAAPEDRGCLEQHVAALGTWVDDAMRRSEEQWA